MAISNNAELKFLSIQAQDFIEESKILVSTRFISNS